MRSVTADDVANWWPLPDAASDKYARGVVGLDVGSTQYPGAALLACTGSLHAGAGMVRHLSGVADTLVLGRHPSVVLTDGRVQAIVVGSGWGDEDTSARFEADRSRAVPMVIDADALRHLPADLPEGSLLTPHAGELARLLDVERGLVESEPVEHALMAAERFDVVVLLKGSRQYVATPAGDVAMAVPGPAWTAQAGSGDVLAGVCGTLLAAGLEPHRAALAAASLQAMTASQFPGPYPPDALAEKFPTVIGNFTRT